MRGLTAIKVLCLILAVLVVGVNVAQACSAHYKEYYGFAGEMWWSDSFWEFNAITYTQNGSTAYYLHTNLRHWYTNAYWQQTYASDEELCYSCSNTAFATVAGVYPGLPGHKYGSVRHTGKWTSSDTGYIFYTGQDWNCWNCYGNSTCFTSYCNPCA